MKKSKFRILLLASLITMTTASAQVNGVYRGSDKISTITIPPGFRLMGSILVVLLSHLGSCVIAV